MAAGKKAARERKPKRAKPKGRCLVEGCRRTAIERGFCASHVSGLRSGLYDASGRQIRPKYAEPPFNRALRKTIKLTEVAGLNAEEIRGRIRAGDEALRDLVNRCMLDINEGTSASRASLTEGKFVFGNIHRIRPSMLQKLVGDDPKKRVRRLAEADKARIAWHLVRGASSKRILEVMPWYTKRQVASVVAEVRSGALPVPRHLAGNRPSRRPSR